MTKKKRSSCSKHTGIAVALAWPETKCKQPGAWYDLPMKWLGFNKNYYYKAGHAALLLIEGSGQVHYFDFGRYHTPFRFGRVRNVSTDFDLEVCTKAVLSEDGRTIVNLHEILNELQNNKSCHGDGTLYASYCPVIFEPALRKVKDMQNRGIIPYGPFRFRGSNCSRFVNTAILSGKPATNYRLKLYFRQPLTPTPLGNINSLANKMTIPKPGQEEELLKVAVAVAEAVSQTTATAPAPCHCQLTLLKL